MNSDYQISINDLDYQETLSKLPGRIAYIDESGSYGFDFNKDGTSKYYILTAVVVETEKLSEFHKAVDEIKKNNGLANTEMKSSSLSDGKRLRLMNMLLPLEFRLAILVADKQRFLEGTPLT